MSIELSRIHKTFGTFEALKGIDLDVRGGELVALLGPSGSGKTTLLRIIAGLETSDRGQVLFHGQDATRQTVQARRVGMVFQHYALFKHMSVFDNVAFGLRVRPRRDRPNRAELRAQVREILARVQIAELEHRYPSQLSGGQRQRVALARALITDPKVLLLDEPFGALDAKVRKDLRRWLRTLHHDLAVTSVFVTHDQEEALEVADRVVIMNHGTIEQVGTPEAVYDDPATPFVYEFLGHVNKLVNKLEPTAQSGGLSYVRPHDLIVSRHDDGSGFAAVVEHIAPVGPTVRLALRGDDQQPLEAELDKAYYRTLELREGQRVYVTPRRQKVFAG